MSSGMTRDEAIMSLWPIAKSLSRLHKDHAGWLDYEDLRQEAMIGAIQAVERYRGTNGASLATYAGKVMYGAVTHAIRDRNHRLMAERVRVDSVDHMVALALADMEDTSAPTALLYAMREAVHVAVARLPERERLCLLLHYWRGWEMEEISAHWGLSRCGASRVHRQALAHLAGDTGCQEMRA